MVGSAATVEHIRPTQVTDTSNDVRAEVRAMRREVQERLDNRDRRVDTQFWLLRQDIRKLAEDVAALFPLVEEQHRMLEIIVAKLDRREAMLQTLLRRWS